MLLIVTGIEDSRKHGGTYAQTPSEETAAIALSFELQTFPQCPILWQFEHLESLAGHFVLGWMDPPQNQQIFFLNDLDEAARLELSSVSEAFSSFSE